MLRGGLSLTGAISVLAKHAGVSVPASADLMLARGAPRGLRFGAAQPLRFSRAVHVLPVAFVKKDGDERCGDILTMFFFCVSGSQG